MDMEGEVVGREGEVPVGRAFLPEVDFERPWFVCLTVIFFFFDMRIVSSVVYITVFAFAFVCSFR